MGTSSVAQDFPVPARRTCIPVEPVVGDAVDDAMVGAPPGWYYDPEDEAIYRYFDGEGWTGHRSDIFSPQPPPAGESPSTNQLNRCID